MATGNFKCPTGQICGNEFQSPPKQNGPNLNFRTSTAVTQRPGGTEVTGGTTTLYYWKPASTLLGGIGAEGSWEPAARTTDGKTWTPLKDDTTGDYVLGEDARRSLTESNGLIRRTVNDKTRESLVTQKVPPAQANKVIATNAASPDSKTGTGATSGIGSTSPTSEPFDQKKALAELKDLDVRVNYDAEIRYPENLNIEKQDTIRFSMYRYVPKPVTDALSKLSTQASVENALGGPISGERVRDATTAKTLGISPADQKGITQPLGTVILPIQPSISDSNSVSWSEDTLGGLTGKVAQMGLNILVPGASEKASPTQETNAPPTDKNGSATSALQIYAGSYFAGQAASASNAKLFTRITGAIENPNMELLFGGPSLRSFNFTFSMSARSDTEASKIKKIIRFFKQGMSVKRSTVALFLKSPHVFKIQYHFRNEGAHPWINQIKECALISCSVNYTPAGNYATYVDGAMTQYDISLSFTELEPIFDDDYKKLDENQDKVIGY